MITKMLEIRDEGTCIASLAIRMVSDDPIEDRFLWRSGYPRRDSIPAVVLMLLSDQKATSDPYEWTYGRTMKLAHVWIIEHWDELKNGDVVDVRVTSLGERTEPAAAEIWTAAMGQT